MKPLPKQTSSKAQKKMEVRLNLPEFLAKRVKMKPQRNLINTKAKRKMKA